MGQDQSKSSVKYQRLPQSMCEEMIPLPGIGKGYLKKPSQQSQPLEELVLPPIDPYPDTPPRDCRPYDDPKLHDFQDHFCKYADRNFPLKVGKYLMAQYHKSHMRCNGDRNVDFIVGWRFRKSHSQIVLRTNGNDDNEPRYLWIMDNVEAGKFYHMEVALYSLYKEREFHILNCNNHDEEVEFITYGVQLSTKFLRRNIYSHNKSIDNTIKNAIKKPFRYTIGDGFTLQIMYYFNEIQNGMLVPSQKLTKHDLSRTKPIFFLDRYLIDTCCYDIEELFVAVLAENYSPGKDYEKSSLESPCYAFSLEYNMAVLPNKHEAETTDRPVHEWEFREAKKIHERYTRNRVLEKSCTPVKLVHWYNIDTNNMWLEKSLKRVGRVMIDRVLDYQSFEVSEYFDPVWGKWFTTNKNKIKETWDYYRGTVLSELKTNTPLIE